MHDKHPIAGRDTQPFDTCQLLTKNIYNIPCKLYLQLSRGEICVANFIPPADGARQGNYFLAKNVISVLNTYINLLF